MSHPIEVTDETFEAEVLKADLPVLVDFWAPWCGPCRMMAPVLEGAAERHAGRVKFAKLNTDESGRSARRFAVAAIPTLILFAEGREKDRAVGFLPPDELDAWLAAQAAPPAAETPGGVPPEAA